ncbi:MAG: hypothetical protein H0U94_12080 [Acidobacteria bacterium]|nr:hypothetical protein [Acidobacteriota bacterium]
MPSPPWERASTPNAWSADRDVSRAPARMGIGSPASSSPMRREKNGSKREPLPDRNTPRFSRKNWRRSGKNTENRVRLTTWRSTSLCPKSGLSVRSSTLFGVTAHLRSVPALAD